jgi:catechol 2,3-dioxygenase-like lactoylglutathione lyase family enzyme
MLITIHPKLPMRDIKQTKAYFLGSLGFSLLAEYEGYLMVEQDGVQLHFFEFKALDPLVNYGQVYIRVQDIHTYYQKLLDRNVSIHPNGHLAKKPWGQIEFSLLDPDHNLLTFGERY